MMQYKGYTYHPAFGIEVVGVDRDECRKLLRQLCDDIDADRAGSPGYTISGGSGSVVCDVGICNKEASDETLPSR